MRHTRSRLFSAALLLLTAAGYDAAAESKKPAAVQSSASPVANPGTADSTVSNYKYEVRGRRDPFRSLDVTNTIQASAAPIVRPAGVKGQLVSEIKLIGVVKSKDGIRAIAEGYRGRTFFIHQGDDLYDGKVLEVRNDSLLLSQILTDSFGKKISQQIVKKLHPTRGEGTNEK
jgi:Tfp pilus assembly protein PilP